jgi:hypothetical protein
MSESDRRPAYYSARPGGWRDWWSILHPPYTAWHLSYVAIGACLAPHVDGVRLLATVLAFFAAVGVAAHALDERHGHPLRTHIPDSTLLAAAGAGLVAAVALGVVGVSRVGWVLLPFIVVGPILVVSYNLELFGGRVHSNVGFAAAWGAFPLLTGYVAQAGGIDAAALIGAFAAFGLSYAQRTLSTPARLIRRHVTRVDGEARLDDGTLRHLDDATLLAPLEGALRWLSWSTVALALALAISRLT